VSKAVAEFDSEILLLSTRKLDANNDAQVQVLLKLMG
jgi:hypothetical protein